MKQRSRVLVFLFTLLVAFATKSKGQIEVAANYVFSDDSLAGFDEPAARGGALSSSCFGREYKVYMYTAKRTFIKQKYQLHDAPAVPRTLFHNEGYANRTTSVTSACDNEDFEVITTQILAPGAVQGWQVASGSNSVSSCNPPTINGNNNYTVFTAPTVDPIANIAVASYFDEASTAIHTGHSFIRLNDASAGAKASKLTKSFIVTPGNALFEYAYLPVIQNGDHLCCEQPGFNIHLTVTNTVSNTSTVLACPQISIAVPGASCSITLPPGTPSFTNADPTCQFSCWVYHNWTAASLDLTAYLGNQITIDVVVVDCIYGGHGAYSYFDSRCSPMTIVGNGNSFPAGTPSVTLPTCGVSTSTICAPVGLGPYSWAGQGVGPPYNTPLNGNQCYVTSISGDYTLTMNPPGSCNPIERIITVTITPAPQVVASVTQAVCGGTLATVSFTALGSASVNPVVSFSPQPISTNTSQNVGSATYSASTGVVTVFVTDQQGCTTSATVNINPVPPQPTIGIVNVTGSSSITCATPSIVLAGATTYTYGSINYFWQTSSFTLANQSVTITAASPTITLYGTDPVSGCVATATTSVRVNTVVPTSAVTPTSQNITCAVGAAGTATGTALTPTVNAVLMWYSPALPNNPVIFYAQTSVFAPTIFGNNGTNTFVVVNPINGCATSKTIEVVNTGGVYPTFTLSSTQNFSIGCNTKSLTTIQIDGAQVGMGGSATSTVLPPGYTGNAYGTSSTVLVYTVNVPGTYTVVVQANTTFCETRVPVSIVQNTFAPPVTAGAPTQILDCKTTSVVLQGNSPNFVSYNWAYQGLPGNTPTFSIGVLTNTAAPTNSIVNNYTLTVRDSNNACTSRTIVTMYQNLYPPKALIGQGSTALTCASNSISLLNGSQSTIPAGFFTKFQPVIGYLWTGPTPQLPDSFATTYIAYTPGTYTMVAKDMNNFCTSAVTTTIGDNRVYPTIITNTSIPLDCDASTTGGVKLIASAQGLTPGQVTAQWLTPKPPPNILGAGTLTLTTDGIGEYKLTVTTNSNGCGRSVLVEVTNGSLTANFTPDKETGFAPLTVNFSNTSASSSTATASSSITSVWSFGNGTTRTTTTNVSTSAVYSAPGTYTVTMFSSKGVCRDTVVKTIFVDIPSKLIVPNVFTPNGDNSNDIFFVQSANLTQISIQIFDRWGNKIYDLNSSTGNIAWDGKNQSGHEAPDGTYFYTIKATGKDGTSYDTKGTVSLYR